MTAPEQKILDAYQLIVSSLEYHDGQYKPLVSKETYFGRIVALSHCLTDYKAERPQTMSAELIQAIADKTPVHFRPILIAGFCLGFIQSFADLFDSQDAPVHRN